MTNVKNAKADATTPDAMKNPAPLLEASKNAMLAEVDYVKADLTYRIAYVELMSLVENPRVEAAGCHPAVTHVGH